MFALIRKDLLLHKTAFYGYTPVMVIYLAYLASQVSSRGAFIVFSCIMSTILPMVLITREEKFGAEVFVCSLPVTRRQVVHAKYIICWIIAFVLAMMGLVLYSIFAGERSLEIWSVSNASLVFFALSLGLGVALPFSLRFGWTGLIAGLVGMQLIGIILLLIVNNFSTNFRLRDVFVGMSDFIAGIHSQLGDPLFYVAVVIILTIFNLASCKIGTALFERREF
jgi:hypothetical protein